MPPPKNNKKAIRYVMNTPGLEDWIRDFSDHLKANPDKNVVVYPESFATGFAKVFNLGEGLTFRIVDYKLNADFLFERKPSKDFYLIIYFYQYTDCSKLWLKINGRTIVENEGGNYSSLLMSNSMSEQQLWLAKDTFVKGLTIQLSEEWLENRISNTDKVDYKMLRKRDVFQSFLKPKSQKLLNEIFLKSEESAFPSLYINSRVLRLLEIFLDDILKNGLDGSVFPSSGRDVQNILKIEKYLHDNYRSQFPSINSLSRMAFMSPTKLKKVFKKAFGVTLFEYFQRNRMHKAKSLLQSELYSVTEVGELLGYQNLSNFSAAFKKEFGVLPRNVKDL